MATIKRNGGITFISAFGFSATICRKAKAAKPRLSRDLVTRMRQRMTAAESSDLSALAAVSAFAASAIFFVSALSTVF